MTKIPAPSRRSFLGVLGIGVGVGAAADGAAAQDRRVTAERGVAGARNYRDPAEGGVAHHLETLLDHENFISAYRFFTEEEIADARSYRAALDLTRPLQAALDAAWSTNRDLFLPAGLYRVSGLTLPGGQAQRTRAFRFHGQGSGELFARGESGGTIVKGTGTGPVLASRQDLRLAGNGNQEVAYIRFEGDSPQAVLDFETLYAQSELHHCGIYQSGVGDGVRVRHANTIELHHNYVLNRDWNRGLDVRRVGTGIRVTATNDNGLLTLRKNTVRGFDWAIRLGEEGTGRLFSARIEQCEASVCGNGFYLAEGIHAAVVENCYFEGGRGGTAIRNMGRGNTLSNNLVFPGFAVAIDDSGPSRATRITGNTLSAGNARTIAAGGCTLIRLQGQDTVKSVHGNYLICDPVSHGALGNVVGIEILGRAPGVYAWANDFDPARPWGDGRSAGQLIDRSGGAGARGMISTGGDSTLPMLSRGALSLGRVVLGAKDFAGETLILPDGSWFELESGAKHVLRGFEGGAHDGRLVVLWDPRGLLRIEPSPIIRLGGARAFVGPGTITFVLHASGGATVALELSRASY